MSSPPVSGTTSFVPYFWLSAGMLSPALESSQLPPGIGPTDQQKLSLDAIADHHHASRVQIAIAWLIHLSPNILAIPGTSSVAHLKENVDAARILLTDEVVDELTAIA